MYSGLEMKGSLKIQKFKEDKFIEEYYFENLITNRGLDYIAKFIGGDITGGINKLAVGNGITPAAKENLALANKLAILDVQKDYSTLGRINFISVIPENFFAKNIQELTEAGLMHKPSFNEYLMTRILFNNTVYVTRENTLSLFYSLELRA